MVSVLPLSAVDSWFVSVLPSSVVDSWFVSVLPLSVVDSWFVSVLPLSAVDRWFVSVLPSSVVDRWFEPWSGKTKNYNIGICCFSSKHTALRKKSKDWWARNQDDVSDKSDMATSGLLFHYKNPTISVLA